MLRRCDFAGESVSLEAGIKSFQTPTILVCFLCSLLLVRDMSAQLLLQAPRLSVATLPALTTMEANLLEL